MKLRKAWPKDVVRAPSSSSLSSDSHAARFFRQLRQTPLSLVSTHRYGSLLFLGSLPFHLRGLRHRSDCSHSNLFTHSRDLSLGWLVAWIFGMPCSCIGKSLIEIYSRKSVSRPWLLPPGRSLGLQLSIKNEHTG